MLKALHILAGILLLACTSTYSFAAEEGGAKTEGGKTASTEVKTETFKLSVTGMTCGGCASKVTKGLNNCEGVTKAEVDQKNDSAVVVVKAGTDIAKVIKAVEAAGFKATKQEADKKETAK